MIAIIIGGEYLLEEVGAFELTRETVQDGSAFVAARAFAARVVAGDDESVGSGADAVDADGEAERVQAGMAVARGAVHVGAGVVDLGDAEGAELGREPV